MIIVPHMAQGSPEWINARLGVLTASQVKELLTTKGALSASRKKLMHRLAAESLLGAPVDEWAGNYWTERGQALEGETAGFFELMTDLKPQACGLIYRDETKQCACSPDWVVQTIPDAEVDTGVEVKCPKASTHVSYLLDQGDYYTQQIQYSLWVSGFKAWYFLSYYPGLNPVLRKNEPDPAWQAAFNKHVPVFLEELADAKQRLGA